MPSLHIVICFWQNSRILFWNSWWSMIIFFFFFFNDTATTEIYTLSLHDALPIWWGGRHNLCKLRAQEPGVAAGKEQSYAQTDRKSTRLNSSHSQISYAVFCLKKKKKDDI